MRGGEAAGGQAGAAQGGVDHRGDGPFAVCPGHNQRLECPLGMTKCVAQAANILQAKLDAVLLEAEKVVEGVLRGHRGPQYVPGSRDVVASSLAHVAELLDEIVKGLVTPFQVDLRGVHDQEWRRAVVVEEVCVRLVEFPQILVVRKRCLAVALSVGAWRGGRGRRSGSGDTQPGPGRPRRWRAVRRAVDK